MEIGKQGEQKRKICYVRAVRRRVGSTVDLPVLRVRGAGIHDGKIIVGVSLHTLALSSREQFYLRQHTVGRLAPSSAPSSWCFAHRFLHAHKHTQPENVALATKPQSSPLCL